MDYVKVWCSVNECGEPIELFHCIQLNRFFFRMHEETDMLISLREEEMGKLMNALGSYLIHIHMCQEEKNEH